MDRVALRRLAVKAWNSRKMNERSSPAYRHGAQQALNEAICILCQNDAVAGEVIQAVEEAQCQEWLLARVEDAFLGRRCGGIS